MISLSPQYTLLAGIFLSLFFSKQEWIQSKAKVWGGKLLQLSVILLGASLNFHSVIKQGADGALITFLSILFVFALGFIGFKILRLDKTQTLLITFGTAICGGSAIAALAPVIYADSMAIAISIGVVFLLNGLAVFIFPFVGELFALSQDQFGTWAALAIHDTSSVVAASSIYGAKALEVATTIKLTRALWIIPFTLLFSLLNKKQGDRKIVIPWFILGFVVLSLVFTFMNIPGEIKNSLSQISKLGFALTLFLIGLSFNFKKIAEVGFKPLIFGIALWIIVSVSSLALCIRLL